MTKSVDEFSGLHVSSGYLYLYIYIYERVCACVCVFVWSCVVSIVRGRVAASSILVLDV